jgi:hypothetical protein
MDNWNDVSFSWLSHPEFTKLDPILTYLTKQLSTLSCQLDDTELPNYNNLVFMSMSLFGINAKVA